MNSALKQRSTFFTEGPQVHSGNCYYKLQQQSVSSKTSSVPAMFL